MGGVPGSPGWGEWGRSGKEEGRADAGDTGHGDPGFPLGETGRYTMTQKCKGHLRLCTERRGHNARGSHRQRGGRGPHGPGWR